MSSAQPPSFGALLRRRRAAAGLTQAQLAAQAGLSPATVAALERGRRRAPRDATVGLLVDALGLDERARARFVAAAQDAAEPRATERRRGAAGDAPGAAAGRWRGSWQLSGQPTPLVDRAQELELITRLLRDGEVRLLTLTGPAGVGKTRLALAAAAQVGAAPDRFPDGVTLVDLAPVRDPDAVLGRTARPWPTGAEQGVSRGRAYIGPVGPPGASRAIPSSRSAAWQRRPSLAGRRAPGHRRWRC